MAAADPELPVWFKSNGFEEYSTILTKELGVEEYDDFRLLRDEKDANELLHDMAVLKPMNDEFKRKFKTAIMKIIGTVPPPKRPKQQSISRPTATLTQSRSRPSSRDITKTTKSSPTRPKPKIIPSVTTSSTKPKTKRRPPSPRKPKSRLESSSSSSEEDIKPVKISKTSSHDSKITGHKKSRSSVTLGKQSKSKKPSSPKRSQSPRHALKRASTSNKITTKSIRTKPITQEDTYDIDSISTDLSYNKSRALKKSQSSRDFMSKNKKKTSHSLSLLDVKKRKMHKEEKNKSRAGTTIHTNRRVRLDDGRIGIVKFKGRTAFGKSSEDWIGIMIEYGKGQHNGTVNGRSYFKCRDGKGVMVRPDRIIEDLGNPHSKPLDDAMKKGDEEIQALLKSIARQRKKEREEKKRKEAEKRAAKERSNYGGDIGWKPAEFDDYNEDQSVGMFKQKLMHSKTLLDKNKDVKAAKKKKVSEI